MTAVIWRCRAGAVIACLLLALSSPALAQTVERYPATGETPPDMLQAALIPAGTNLLYVTGQVASPRDPRKTGSHDLTLADMGDTETQTASALAKIRATLEAHGYKMSDVVRLTVFLVGDPAKGGRMDYAGMSAAYRRFFGTEENPNRTTRVTVQVAGLASPASLVELEATAAK